MQERRWSIELNEQERGRLQGYMSEYEALIGDRSNSAIRSHPIDARAGSLCAIQKRPWHAEICVPSLRVKPI